MKTKIMNWLENHEMIYGVGLLIVSVFTVAFGGAYLGANMAMPETIINVNVSRNDNVNVTIE
jgi:hypothetical protein